MQCGDGNYSTELKVILSSFRLQVNIFTVSALAFLSSLDQVSAFTFIHTQCNLSSNTSSKLRAQKAA